MDFDELQNRLKDVKEYAVRGYVPIIRDDSARFLYDYIAKNNCKDILEIGTAIGYSGSIILSANDCFLTTVEIDSVRYEMAKNTFNTLGYLDRVSMYLMDARDLIEGLAASGKTFDLIFLDGPKGQYINYLPCLTELLKDGGVILADNILMQGMVESDEQPSHKHRSMVMHLRKYMDVVTKDPYETEIVRIEDGLAITKYRGKK